MVTTGVWLVMAAGLAMHGGDAFLISPGPSLNGRMSALPLRLKCASLQLQPDSLLKADNRRRSRPSCLCMQEDKDAGMGFSEESYTMSLQDEVDDDDVVLKLPKPDPSMDVQGLQLRLLKACCGLDRGAAAGESERRSVFDAVSNLEDLVMDGREFEEDGLWRLIFSSALSAGSGSGGGAGKNSLPIFQTADTARLSLGPGSIVGQVHGETGLRVLVGHVQWQVYQRVQRRKKSLDNIVEFVLRAPFVSAVRLGWWKGASL
eukprot:756669-Hanusia_phi.AAC.1